MAGVGPGSIAYVAGAGPVGLAAAASCQLLGAACTIVGDMIPERLAQARSFGCETIDLRQDGTLKEMIADLIPSTGGVVDAAVDAVGFEARGTGKAAAGEVPAQVLNDVMTIVREGGAIGIPGLYVTEDPGGIDNAAQFGNLSIRIGLGWSLSHSFHTGQCPVMKYNKQLMTAILHDKLQIAKAVGVEVISLDDAPNGYKEFDAGAAKKYVIDPHNMTGKA
jgi:glutathione-independent formaldehyde dehydrogenase